MESERIICSSSRWNQLHSDRLKRDLNDESRADSYPLCEFAIDGLRNHASSSVRRIPILNTRAVCSSLLIIIASLGTALGQNEVVKNHKDDEVTITAAATGERVRLAAFPSVVQIRLEVYDSTGKKLVDHELRGGNVLDWHLEDGQAEYLRDDIYLCVVTVKSL